MHVAHLVGLLAYGLFAVCLFWFLEWAAYDFSNEYQLPWFIRNRFVRVLMASVWPLVMVVVLFCVAEEAKHSRH